MLAAVSWNRWIEPYVDTGRELMTPWRLAQGETLYRDIHFPHGPLGPYLAAASDRIVGRSLPARVALAAVIALLHLAALERLSRRALGPWRAALATSAAVAAAMFLRPGGWLFPFSLDTAIAVAALTWACVLHDRADSKGRAAATGLCLAAALLARPEMGLAAVAIFFAARREPPRLLRLTALPLAAAAVAYGALSIGLSRDRLVADGWLRFLDPPEAYRNVYRSFAGLDRIGLRVAELLLAVLVLALGAALLAAAAFLATRGRSSSRTAAALLPVLAIGILAAAAAVRFHPPESLVERLSLFPPLVRVIPPWVVVAGALRLLVRMRAREPRGLLAKVPDAMLWIAALFSLRLLLAAGYVGPYAAFFLPLPLVVALTGVFALADRAAPTVQGVEDDAAALGDALPRLTAAALSIFVFFRVASMAQLYRGRPWPRVDTPVGSLRLTEPVAAATRDVLADLARRLPDRATLAGFPETGFYNYALGRRSPFWLDQFFPGHLDETGEARAISVLDSRPPDALLYANVLAAGEGTRAFGRDYSVGLDAAARARFRPAAAYGPGGAPGARIGDPAFFVEVLVPRENGP